MDILPSHPLLEFPEGTIESIRKMYALDKPGRMAEAVNMLDEWVKQQEHLVKKDFSKHYLENTLIGTKGSMERAKLQIDKMCTLRTLVPKFFECCNLNEELNALLDHTWLILLPKLTKDLYRVLIVKVKNTDFAAADFIKFYHFVVIMLEYIKQHDYCTGYIIVNDYSQVNVTDVISKISLVELQQFFPVVTEGFGTRLKGILFITPSKLIDGFIKLIKPFLSEKIANRFHVYNSIEDMYEFIPQDLLPAEYGGKERSMELIHFDWCNILSSEEHVNYMKDINKACTDESFRKKEKFNEQYMGMPGTFRTLSVD